MHGADSLAAGYCFQTFQKHQRLESMVRLPGVGQVVPTPASHAQIGQQTVKVAAPGLVPVAKLQRSALHYTKRSLGLPRVAVYEGLWQQPEGR